MLEIGEITVKISRLNEIIKTETEKGNLDEIQKLYLSNEW